MNGATNNSEMTSLSTQGFPFSGCENHSSVTNSVIDRLVIPFLKTRIKCQRYSK